LCEEVHVAQRIALETNAIIMAGNMTKLEALHWLAKYGAVTWGYPEEAAAAYLGLGVKHFREEVAYLCRSTTVCGQFERRWSSTVI